MDWSKLLSLPGPTALAAFVASAGITLGYERNFALLRSVPQKFIVYANIGVFVFGAIALVWATTGGIKFILKAIRKSSARREYEKEIDGFLDTLSEEEGMVLYTMVANNQRSITCPLMDPIVTRLKQKQLLLPGMGVGNSAMWPHTIPTGVWNALKKRAEITGSL